MKSLELESCVYYHLKDYKKPKLRKKKIINKINEKTKKRK